MGGLPSSRMRARHEARSARANRSDEQSLLKSMALDQSQHNELLAQNLARRRPQNAPRSVQAFTGEPRCAIVGTARDGRELADPAASTLPCAGFALHSPLMTSRISSWAAR